LSQTDSTFSLFGNKQATRMVDINAAKSAHNEGNSAICAE